MYVVPYVMGPLGSPFSKVGIEVTDSPYVVANMRIMTRMGQAALDQLGGVRGVRARPALASATSRPTAASSSTSPRSGSSGASGSGYGGNALLGKKCFALRIASDHGPRPGLDGRAHADPRARAAGRRGPLHGRGLSRRPAARPTSPCWSRPSRRRATRSAPSGDDIAWLRPGPDGRLWAVNPEAGFFGVVPGTGPDTNPNAMATIARDTIFTNVAVTPRRRAVVGGQGQEPARRPPRLAGQALGRHGQGRPSQLALHRRRAPVPEHVAALGGPAGRAALRDHLRRPPRPRSRRSCSRAATGTHGVFVGATMGSETTAAATGQVGVVRRDPMAMLPFCGYNMGDYFGHWLRMGSGARAARRRSST